ncbi:MAG TPA: glycosyltransferase family 39 protein, partial [Pyrinomonadaceae bacterium]|nr:glycosyltransferase family 39 protein [Pyrinomonadaceae bacterium]
MDGESKNPAGVVQNPLAWAAVLALVKLALHFSFNGNYGYFRDELYYVACGEHLAFGYPDHAPLIALVTKVARTLLGDSLFALRFFSAVAGAAKVFLTGLIAVELGGRRFAVLLACLCVLVAPAYLAVDNLLSMNAFEPAVWGLCAWLAIRAVRLKAPRLWLWFGVVAGVGLMNKHSMLFFGLAVVTGLLLTRERRVFRGGWIWAGGAVALLIFLPNLVWQVRNDWATVELLRNVGASGKNVVLAPHQFVWEQVFILLPLTAPVWLGGLWFFLFDREGKRFRFLGIAYLVAVALMIALKAKSYYLIPIYPYLFAGGAVWFESWGASSFARRVVRYAYPCVVLVCGLVLMPLALPVLSVENYLRYQNTLGVSPPKAEVGHAGPLPQVYGDQFGWPEMTAKVAEVYHSLPPEERAKAAIFANNYGEAGAVDFFGGRYGLPKAVSPHQSYFLWGHRGYTGEVLIVLGDEREDAEEHCRSVEETLE